jgi:guanyl-specific ribonuclease Sa
MNIKTISRDTMPVGIREAIRDIRFNAKYGNPTVFNNYQNMLPNAGSGNTYYEHDVGADRQGGRGRFRIVVLVDNGDRLLNIYFTSAHYDAEWTEIVW